MRLSTRIARNGLAAFAALSIAGTAVIAASGTDAAPRRPAMPRTPDPVRLSALRTQLADKAASDARLAALAARARRTPRPARRAAPAASRAVPVPVYEPGSLRAIAAANWPGDDAKLFRVISCESNWNPRTVGRAGERGLMQIHPGHFDGRWGKPLGPARGFTWDEMFDPARNVQFGYELWKGKGWGPWTCA